MLKDGRIDIVTVLLDPMYRAEKNIRLAKKKSPDDVYLN